MSDDVCAELAYAKECIQRGNYDGAILAIVHAERAWRIEVDGWACELAAAEREINGRTS